MCNVILRRFCVASVTMGKQLVLHILSVAMVVQQAKCMCHMILSSMACSVVSYFSTVSQFCENVIDHKMCVDFLYNFV